jgi:hypothetical protein
MNVLYSIRIIACWWHIICTMYDWWMHVLLYIEWACMHVGSRWGIIRSRRKPRIRS